MKKKADDIIVAKKVVKTYDTGKIKVKALRGIDLIIRKGDMVAIESLKGEGIALARALMPTREIMEKDKGIVADTFRVLMNKGTYPSIWKS